MEKAAAFCVSNYTGSDGKSIEISLLFQYFFQRITPVSMEVFNAFSFNKFIGLEVKSTEIQPVGRLKVAHACSRVSVLGSPTALSLKLAHACSRVSILGSPTALSLKLAHACSP